MILQLGRLRWLRRPEHGAPQIAQPVAEKAQRHRVTRHSMITVIAFDHTFQPLSYDVDPLMHSLAQHRFDRSAACIRLGWVVRPTTK